jgi:HD-GYP domain-containing protein (c-di-GMP phosphodiesterase class II)
VSHGAHGASDDADRRRRTAERQPVRQIVRHHHERLDGTGYPDPLAGQAIPLLAQMIGGVDAYDAMTINRGTRK